MVGIPRRRLGWTCTARPITVYVGVHHVQDRVATSSPNRRRGWRRGCVSVSTSTQHLHEALRLALLHGAPDAGHGAGGDQGRTARCAHLRLGLPTRPSGGSMYSAFAVDAVGDPITGRRAAGCRRRSHSRGRRYGYRRKRPLHSPSCHTPTCGTPVCRAFHFDVAARVHLDWSPVPGPPPHRQQLGATSTTSELLVAALQGEPPPPSRGARPRHSAPSRILPRPPFRGADTHLYASQSVDRLQVYRPMNLQDTHSDGA